MDVQKFLPNDPSKKAVEKVTMTRVEALQLLNEVAPKVQGFVVGEHPKLERLADIMGYDLKLVN